MRSTILPARRTTAIALAVALVAGTLTLGGAIGLGIRLPGGWFSSAPQDTTDFDYSALGRPLKRLRESYVKETLAGQALFDDDPTSGSASTNAARRVPVAHAFTNDDFERAYRVQNLPFAARSDTTGATRQSAEPVSCAPVGGTAWYRYRAPSDAALFADTFGSTAATSLAVFTGERLGALNAIGCDTNVLGNAQIGFRATKATTYWFQVTSPRGGSTVFELAAVGSTTVISRAPSGEPADGGAFDHPDISADGRYIAFASYARNLAPNPPPCPDGFFCETLYLRDRVTGKTTALATQGNGDQQSWAGTLFAPSFSADGRYLSYVGWPPVGFRGSPEADPVAFSVYLYDQVTGRTELVSRNSSGEATRSNPVLNWGAGGAVPVGSLNPSVSADGRYVVFNSDAENLGGPVERGKLNVYIRDRVLGTTRLVSTDESGQPNHGDSCAGTGRNVSHDGRFVAFMSTYGTGTDSPAGHEVAGSTDRPNLIYLWDARTGRSRLISKLPPGAQPQTLGNYCVGISKNGSHVGFVSRDALVADDTNGTPDVYVYTVATGHIQRVSVTSAGEQTVDPNVAGEQTGFFKRGVTLSADGRFAAFDSAAPDLAPGAVGRTGDAGSRPPGPRQVYVHDLVTGATTLASVSSTGEPLPGESILPYISPDGRSVTFMHVEPSGRLEVMVHHLS
jgi:Tol biopolymer transport system component